MGPNGGRWERMEQSYPPDAAGFDKALAYANRLAYLTRVSNRKCRVVLRDGRWRIERAPYVKPEPVKKLAAKAS